MNACARKYDWVLPKIMSRSICCKSVLNCCTTLYEVAEREREGLRVSRCFSKKYDLLEKWCRNLTTIYGQNDELGTVVSDDNFKA